jgi:hypothetical protein
MVAEMEFVGGPLDGRVVDVPDGRVPCHIEVEMLGDVPLLGDRDPALDPDADLPVTTYWYQAVPSPHDDGPLWHAVPAPSIDEEPRP